MVRDPYARWCGKGSAVRRSPIPIINIFSRIEILILISTPCKQNSREKFAILFFVEPRALDVEEFETGNEARQRERVDRELRDRPIGAGVGLIVEDVDGAVAYLKKVDVSGDTGIGRCIGAPQ